MRDDSRRTEKDEVVGEMEKTEKSVELKERHGKRHKRENEGLDGVGVECNR